AIARCDQMYVQGQSIRIIEGKQIYVSSIAGYYENYYVADMFIANKGDDRVDALPENGLFIAWANGNDTPVVNRPVPPEKIAAKISSRAKWATFFGSLAAAFATQTVNVDSTTNGRITAVGPGGVASGVYSETSTSTITMA